MKDNGPVMAENPHLPFKMEREVTLMPNEFRDRLSASTRSRKSSAARSASIRKTRTSQSDNIGHLNAFSEELDNGVDLAYQDVETRYEPFSEDAEDSEGNIIETSQRDKPEVYPADLFRDKPGSGNAIELEENMKFMLDNAYTNYEKDNNHYSIKTPPSNMNIGDLIVPLEDWSSRDSIREKKYTVLPSIQSPQSERSNQSASKYGSSRLSFNNQLDFGRERMEQEADFFADFRVNTSKVKPTPRQDPLPPIPQGPSNTPRVGDFGSELPSSGRGRKKRGRSKDRQKFV